MEVKWTKNWLVQIVDCVQHPGRCNQREIIYMYCILI